MNNAIRLRRLKKAVEILKAVPTEKFHMDYWGHTEYFDKPLKIKIPDNFVHVDCRTSACALGWLSMDKGFRKAGLTFRADISQPSHGDVLYGKSRSEYAGRDFFGITYYEAQDLFIPSDGFPEMQSELIKPRHVIAKIKKLIKKYGDL